MFKQKLNAVVTMIGRKKSSINTDDENDANDNVPQEEEVCNYVLIEVQGQRCFDLRRAQRPCKVLAMLASQNNLFSQLYNINWALSTT